MLRIALIQSQVLRAFSNVPSEEVFRFFIMSTAFGVCQNDPRFSVNGHRRTSAGHVCGRDSRVST